jgi:hypothetical protein
MKVFALFCFLASIVVSSGYSRDTTSSEIYINFNVPREWKKVNDSIYVLTNYKKKLNFESSYLAQGHMQWRLDPKNIAVTCLWDFGITDSTTVFNFAKRLTEVKENKIYSLRIDSTRYIIYVRTKKHTPLAYRLEVKRGLKNNS